MMGVSEVEDQPSVVQPEHSSAESSKKPIRSYTREFLLSLSELDVCKNLPSGFDASLLSELEDTSSGFQDRQRVLGSSPTQGFKRTDYGSSVGRGDSGSYSRGGLNRWDSRSSGRSDTDTDSESGRRFGNQARRSWQSPEHDGLLGSGSFPRPAGYAAGAPVPRFRPNDNIHLNRSNEPYHPPRPYKAAPHSRREANDSFNDETFGSADDASEDRVEEEKKRRAEFEFMRKEQQKALQEKQKSNQGKTKDPLSDIGLLETPSHGKTPSDLDKILKQAPHDDSSKLSVSSQAPPSRPLVPPGFVSSVDKSSTASLTYAEPLETGKPELEDIQQDVKNKAHGSDFSDSHIQTSGTSIVKAEKALDLFSALQGSDLAKAPRLPDVNDVLENGEIMGLDYVASGPPKLLGEPARPTSILDRLFGNALTPSNDNSTSTFVEDDAEPDDIWSSNTLHSKFAHWFPEEDRKRPGDISSEKPKSSLTLFVGEKGGSDVPDLSAMESIFNPEMVPGQKTYDALSSTAEISEQFSNSCVTEAKPAVLTCEDLEQSMLSEIGGDTSNFQSDHALEFKVARPTNNVDNQASQRLLSLLQRGIGSKDVASVSVEERIPDKPLDHEVGKLHALDSSVINVDGSNNSAKTLTLESLFGTAFMKELHSAQRNTIDSARIDASDGALFPTAMSGNGINHMASNDGITTLDKVGEWLGFNDAVELSEQPAEVDFKIGGIDRGIQVTLPEEDSLINLIDPINSENSMLVLNSGSSHSDLLPSSSSIPFDVLTKLAALGGTPRDERSMLGGHDPRLLRGSSDRMKPELPFQTLHPQASSPQLHASQMNHSRPLFHALDSHPAHLDPHLNFMPPEAIIHRDAPTHPQFSANIGHPSFPHPSAGLPGFDRPIPPSIMQQMHMAGNLPPHLARGFPGGAPMPPHPGHNPAGYVQEPNPMQNFPFGQRQSYFGGPGMGPPGPELIVGDSPPEAFQRLLDMELGANPKQMHLHPFAAGGPSQAMYGHELDTGFRYR